MLISPLPYRSILLPNINVKTLTQCADILAECFIRVIRGFPANTNFCKTVNNYDDDIIDAILKNNNALLNAIIDRKIWEKFYADYPEQAKELEYAVDICLDYGVAKKTKTPDAVVKSFLQYKLHKILELVPGVHLDHILKPPPIKLASPGRVPDWKIEEIRNKHLNRLILQIRLPRQIYVAPEQDDDCELYF